MDYHLPNHIVENLLGLKSKQATSFLHATLADNDKVHVDMSHGFKHHGSNGKFKFSISRKLFMACIEVLVLSGNILVRDLATAAPLMLVLTLPLDW